MGDPLICPECGKGTLKWDDADIDREDLFDNGIMECVKCHKQYKGFPEYNKAIGFDLEKYL